MSDIRQTFIKSIALYVQKYAIKYNIKCCSAVIAQACLESAYGTSKKAKQHNYFGLKYRENRLTCHSGYFTDGSSEQLQNGKYVKISAKWFKFDSMENGVEGYFQFINTNNYKNLKGISDYNTYLKNIRADGYATSLDYVNNCKAIIRAYNLTKYDSEVIKMATPKIIKNISKYNNSSRNGNGIRYIVIHYTGNKTDTAKANANYFATGNRNASAHYFVDSTSIYQSVEDNRAAWHVGVNYGSKNLFGICTNRNSIGIEMCSNGGKISDATFNKTVELTKYLMKKYDIPGNKVVRHYDVCSKSCPGWKGWIPSDESIWKKFKKAVANSTTTTFSDTITSTKEYYGGLYPVLPAKGYLGRGDSGLQVTRMQSFFRWYGSYKDSVDGSFGKNTELAVKAFQKAKGLEVDGFCGPLTLAEMKITVK